MSLYNEDAKKIDRIVFSIYTNKDVQKYSAIDDPFGINFAESYVNHEPKKGGLVDPRMGTCDLYLPCSTCGLNYNDCPGHFGHIMLASPVFHFGFMNHLKTILHCICIRCSKILIDKPSNYLKKNMLKSSENRLKDIKGMTKNVVYCFNCGAPVSKIKREVKDTGTIKIIIERDIHTTNGVNTDKNELFLNKKIRESINPQECYNILRNISDTDCFILGFNPKIARPEDLIITIFPVPPVIIRPTAKMEFMSATKSEDALTIKISDIIRTNKTVRQQLEKEVITNETNKYNQEFYALLQYHVATYFDNDSLTLPRTEFRTGGRALKSISERVKGKTGRVRANLMGKRVDFSARSVITPDPYIDIDMVGIPKNIAMILTIPEEVTQYNIKYLSGLVNNGQDVYPGANCVLRTIYRDGKGETQKFDLKYRKKTIKLNIGYVVERHCIDNDYVLFNRQPTLHKPSMMGHRLQIIDNDNLHTFRMNLSVCKPYAADFDGDEMNIFLAQSIQARNELKRIASVQYQIIGARDSNPIIGCQMDSISGGYMLTNPKTKMYGWQIANILCNTTAKYLYDIDMNKEYSGHEIFSHIIPHGINIDRKDINIVNGKLISGYINDSAIANKRNSIIQFIWDKYGPSKTRKFIDDVQRLVLQYLLYKGMTMHFGDVINSETVDKNIMQIIDNKILEVKYNITQYENDTDQLSKDIYENLLLQKLSRVQSDIGIILESIYTPQNNFLMLCAKSGARGTIAQITQITSTIGMVAVDGQLISKKIENRSLIYFHRDDDTPCARGFVKSSFSKGLNSVELFYNTMACRDGLIDTAIKTATTGYISRQLIKGMEDLTIKYDGTNRNSRNVIIQQVYGENGIDQTKQSLQVLNIINMNNNDIEEKLCLNKKQIDEIEKTLGINGLDKFNKKYISLLIDMRDRLRVIQRKSLIQYKVIMNNYMLPVNLQRITQDYTNKKLNDIIDLNPIDIINSIDNFIEDYNYRIISILNKNDIYMKKNNINIKFLFHIALYEYLTPVKCIYQYGLSKKQFNLLMDEIKLNFIKSLVEPGEMVGIIAAQSIGEPTTQMTLNTKHFAGSSNKKSANMGVPRIQELLHYSKNIKTPQMTVYFNEPYNTNRAALNKVISYFKHLSIRQLVSSVEVYYDTASSSQLSLKLKADNVINPFFINNIKTDVTTLPFVFRIKLDVEKMMDKETTTLDIKTKFIGYWYNKINNLKSIKRDEKDILTKITKCAILSNQTTDKEQIIHIRFSMAAFSYNMIIDFLNIVFDEITLKGLDNIEEIDVNEHLCINYDAKTGDIINSKEFVVITSGININKLRQIKGVNMVRSRCNDIETIYKKYGIEATRQILLNEFQITYEYSSITINYNQLAVLVDQMCHLGEVISIDRHGISKIENDTISKASFEKTMDHFINAAIYNEIDTIKSVSSSIAVGRVIPGGTGSFDLLLDIAKLEQSEYNIGDTFGRISFIQLEEDPIMNDIIKYNNYSTNFILPQ